ncbi:hypothetical protein G6F56_013239 [Rhizopus delemar]|nr:hypothetical protein G6F56_013239 [Rhizopus delemar]
MPKFESGSDSAPSPNGSVQDDQMSLGGVSVFSNQIESLESHQDMEIDNNSGNLISEDNDDQEEDSGYGPIMYEHVTSDEQISHVDSLAIGLYKLCDQHKVTRQFKRDLSNYLDKKLISKLGEDKIDEIAGMLPEPDQVSRRVKGRNSQTKLVKNYDLVKSLDT